MTMPPGPMPPIRPEYTRPALTGVKSLRGLMIAASILLGTAAAASSLVAVSFFDRADIVDLVADGANSILMHGMVASADAGVLGWLLITGVLTVATGAVLIIWQYLYAENAQLMGGPLELGSGWAIAGWFIPVANLVLPYMQLGQSYAASDPVIPAAAGRLPRPVFAWMTANLFAAVLFPVSIALRPGDDTQPGAAIERFALADRVAATAMLLYAAAGVFAILSVVTLTRRQRWAVIPADY